MPLVNAPRGQTTSAPPVVETVAGSTMHSVIHQAAVTSLRQSPMPMVSGSPMGGTPKRPAPVIVPAPRNSTSGNFRPTRQPAHAAVAQPAILAGASVHGISAPIDALGGLRTYPENRGKLSKRSCCVRPKRRCKTNARRSQGSLRS